MANRKRIVHLKDIKDVMSYSKRLYFYHSGGTVGLKPSTAIVNEFSSGYLSRGRSQEQRAGKASVSCLS